MSGLDYDQQKRILAILLVIIIPINVSIRWIFNTIVVVVDINSPNVGTPRLRVEQIFNVTIRTKVLI